MLASTSITTTANVPTASVAAVVESKGPKEQVSDTKVTLLSHQHDHVKFIEDLYSIKKEQLYIDCSVMGSGKTYVAMYMAQKYKLDLFVVCPKSLIHTWTSAAKVYKIGVVHIGTFASMRTKSNKWLTKEKKEVVLGNNKLVTKTFFTPTKEFTAVVKKGILYVIDEIQNLKNDSDQTNACAALSRAVITRKSKSTVPAIRAGNSFFKDTSTAELSFATDVCRSKIALLSATPFDKKEHALNLFRVTGIMEQDELFEPNYFGRGFELLGLQDILNKCRAIDRELTDKYSYVYDKKSAIQTMYTLFVHVFRPYFMSIMPEPKIDSELDCKNYFCHISEPSIQSKMQVAISDLASACRFKNGTIGKQEKMDFSAITVALMRIEHIKVDHIIKKRIRKELEESETKKVIVFVNYYSTAESILGDFGKYKPLFLNGKMDTASRVRVVDAFQEPNTKYRLFIANTQVGGIGIDLDDRHGGFPRHMFIVPTYNILNIHQASGRIYRSSTKSKATVRMVYSKLGEDRVINAIATKTTVLNSIATTSTSTVKFPGDYEQLTESEGFSPSRTLV